MKLTKGQQFSFLEYWLMGHRDGTSEHNRKVFARIEKRVAPLLEGKNVFAIRDIFKHYFAGEYLYSLDVFGLYLLLSYKKTQTRLSWILERMNASKYHFDTCVPFCLGLYCTHPELFYVTFTHDLEVVEVRV